MLIQNALEKNINMKIFKSKLSEGKENERKAGKIITDRKQIAEMIK